MVYYYDGNKIIETRYGGLPDSGYSLRDTIQHECMHTCQVARDGGFAFSLGYFFEWLRCRREWSCNRYEIEAASVDGVLFRPPDYGDLIPEADVTARRFDWIDKPAACPSG